MSEKINVFINRTKYELTNPVQTGRALKQLAGIPLTDVLFLQQPHEDLVIANDSTVTLKSGAHLHSQPPADYGLRASVRSSSDSRERWRFSLRRTAGRS